MPFRGADRAVLLSLPLATLLVACGPGADTNFGNPTVLVDSTAERYDWICTSDRCELAAQLDLTVTCGGQSTSGEVLIFGRLARICSAFLFNDALFWTPDLCRILTCSSASDCPRTQAVTYACEHGLCQRHDAAMTGEDVLGLCIASIPRTAQCGDPATAAALSYAQVEVASSCPGGTSNPCTIVPSDCRMP